MIIKWTADNLEEGHLAELLADGDIAVRHAASSAMYCDDPKERKRCREYCAKALNKRASDAGNMYHSYMRGWRDGAVCTAMRKEFTERAETDCLRMMYELGYSNGRNARADASEEASKVIGYTPSILRLAR